ncbi:arsenate reductase family protein [Streptococcus sp. H49]|uniref:arsenate reductase family protein n=1 Tax=Streptococcus huangxiaojuni TaxID=3237239 RepID=UPI0034A23D4D
MLVFYEYPKCSTCRKAKTELKELGLTFEAVDIKKSPPQAEDIVLWMKRSDYPLKAFFNTSGQSYRAHGLKDKIQGLTVTEAAALLAADGMLLKRPILVKDGELLQLGYRTAYRTLNL